MNETVLSVFLNDIWQEISKSRSLDNNNGFNIFSSLRIEQNEVLICRFLGALLDPRGIHGMSDYPLRSFLKIVLNQEDADKMDLTDAYVVLEEPVKIDSDGSERNRRVDIAIHIGETVFPIEVKIWAGDQQRQLNDYYHYYFGNYNGKRIFYLTPTGHEPSDESRGDLTDKQIKCISFTDDICEWAEDLIAHSSNEEIESLIKQFKEIIINMSDNELEKIKNRININNSDEIKSLLTVLNNSDDLIKHIQKEFLKKTVICNTNGNNDFLIDEVEKKPESWSNQAVLTVRSEKYANLNVWLSFDGSGLYLLAKTARKPNISDWKEDKSNFGWKRIKDNNIMITVETFADNPNIRIDISDDLKKIAEATE